MADSKITELTAYTPPITTDVIPIVDVTTSTTKKVTYANLKTAISTYTDTAPNINVKSRAYASAAQDNLSNGVWTKVILGTENYDVGSDFATSTFTVPVTGYYHVSAGVTFANPVVSKRYGVSIYVNGGAVTYTDAHASIATYLGVPISDIIYLVAAQTVELYCISLSGDNTIDLVTGTGQTFMAIHLLSI